MGQVKYSSAHEAGEVAKEGIKTIREADLATTRQLYNNAEKALKDNAFVDSRKIADSIEKLETKLKPGQVKSGEQRAVLDALEKLKRDLYDSNGTLLYAKVKDLMNNKLGIQDIINYEVQGGAKQLLKGVVHDIDRAIISHGKDNPTFARNYINANKKFSQHAKTFRNKEVEQLLRTTDPAQLMNKMNSIQGIRSLENILNRTPQGKEIFNGLKRNQLEKVIGDNLIDSTSKQVKLGTFSKLLEKGKNKSVIKEILSPSAFKRLERLQKNAGALADAAEKFYNSSKSGVVAADAAVIGKVMIDLAHVLYGNPWPLLKTGGVIVATRKLSKLLADPEFLRLTEEAILASKKGSQSDLIQAFMRLKPFVLAAETQQENQMEESQPL